MATQAELSNPPNQAYDLPNGSDTSSQMASRLRERVAHAKDRVSDAVSAAKDRSFDLRDRAADSIQSAPFVSIAVAVGVGVLIGWILAKTD
jgi:ElaB/YqjD/DUF883 family membrane-anchored ribosome-binding protein